MSFDFMGLLKNIAPMIVGSFATPAAGLAVKALIDAAPDQHKSTLQAAADDSKDSFIKKFTELFQQGAIQSADVKKAELAHAERMAEMGYKNAADLAKIAADDRASARARQVQLKDRTPAHLAYIIILGFFIGAALQIGAFTLFPEKAAAIPREGWLLIGQVFGYLASEAKAAANFFFGSSTGSKEKDDVLAQIAKG